MLKQHQFDWHLFLAILIPILIVVSCLAISLGLVYYYNNQPTVDEIDPQTQYHITYISSQNKYDHNDSIDIFLESVSKHTLNITIQLRGYEYNFKSDAYVEYRDTKNITLKSGHFEEFCTNKYRLYTEAVIEEVIVEPNPTAEVDLTCLANLIFFMVAMDFFFCFGTNGKNKKFMKPCFYLTVCLFVTAALMSLFVLFTRHLLMVDINFCILGIYF